MGMADNDTLRIAAHNLEAHTHAFLHPHGGSDEEGELIEPMPLPSEHEDIDIAVANIKREVDADLSGTPGQIARTDTRRARLRAWLRQVFSFFARQDGELARKALDCARTLLQHYDGGLTS